MLPQPQLDRISELSFLRRLAQQLQVDCVLDVGANRGQFALELRDIGYEGRLISFEPISSEYSVPASHFENDPKWRGYRIALGSQSESKSITIPRLAVVSSLSWKRKLWKPGPGRRLLQ
jgi:hypothetical protein